jgi:hypothetical protein
MLWRCRRVRGALYLRRALASLRPAALAPAGVLYGPSMLRKRCFFSRTCQPARPTIPVGQENGICRQLADQLIPGWHARGFRLLSLARPQPTWFGHSGCLMPAYPGVISSVVARKVLASTVVRVKQGFLVRLEGNLRVDTTRKKTEKPSFLLLFFSSFFRGLQPFINQ